MKKISFGKACVILLAVIAAFVITSCGSPINGNPTDKADSPASVLRNIVIGVEILAGSSSNGARSVLSDLQNSSTDVPLYLQQSSRGTICLYFLKYGLSKHPALQTKEDFGKVIEWGIFKNDNHSYGNETEKYMEDYWAGIKPVIDNFNMGKLSVNETDDGKYEVIQVDPGKEFTHYILLTPTDYGTYDIDFYAVEVMGSKPEVYYEQTKFTSASNFTVKRFYYNVTNSMHSFGNVKDGITSLTTGNISYVYDFAGKTMHGLEMNNFSGTETFRESYTDFVYAADKTGEETRYGISKNNGTMVLSSTRGYVVKYLEGTAEINDDMTNVYNYDNTDHVCLKPEYVGEGKAFKCTVNLNTASLDAELTESKNLKTSLLTASSITGLSNAVNILSDTFDNFFPAAD